MAGSGDGRNKDRQAAKQTKEQRVPRGSAKNQKQGTSARFEAQRRGTGTRDARGR